MKRIKILITLICLVFIGFTNSKAQSVSIGAIWLTDIQVFFLTDLDLNNPGSSPPFFQITLSNETMPLQPVEVFLTIEFVADGILLASGNTQTFVLDQSTTVYTSQNFGSPPLILDNYSIEDNEVNNIATQIAQTGALPSKLYELKFGIVLAENANTQGETSLFINPENPTQVQLLAPGSSAEESPNDPTIPTIYSSNPTYSWDTNSTDVTLTVVEWMPGDDKEAAFNGPALIEANITGGLNTFTPQTGFFPMEAGKTYLWRLTLNTPSSSGLITFTSEAYVYRLDAPDNFASGPQLQILKGMLYDLFPQDEVDALFNDPDKLKDFVLTGVVLKNGQSSSLEEFREAIDAWIAQAQQASFSIQ